MTHNDFDLSEVDAHCVHHPSSSVDIGHVECTSQPVWRSAGCCLGGARSNDGEAGEGEYGLVVRFCELRRNLGAPLDVRKSRVPFGLGVLTGLLVVGLFLASVLTTSRLSNGVSHSYQRALAATNLELAVTRASALENTAITSHTRGTINDFAAALKRAEGAEANLDAFERTPVGVARYLTLEHRIVALLNSGNYPQAEHLDHATENSATARMVASQLRCKSRQTRVPSH